MKKVKEHWQILSALVFIIFSAGIFYSKTSAYDKRIETVEEKQDQINEIHTSIKVIENEIKNINQKIGG